MDKMTPEQRHRCMAAIHSRNTRPEMIVRRYLHACGYRYRVNHPRLPGKPDVVLRKFHACVFVNGCFWHGHDCGLFSLPKTNTQYWKEKIERNKERDRQNALQLARMGWHVLTIWECQLKPSARLQTLQGLDATLSTIYLNDRRPLCKYQEIEEEDNSRAAETTDGENLK